MKKMNLFIALSFFTVLIKAQLPKFAPSKGILGYWSFDKTFNDVSGNNITTLNNGAVLSFDIQNNPEKACYLDGSSFLAIKDNDLLRPKQITINIMVKPERINEQSNPLFYKGQFEVYELDLRYFGIKQNSGCISYSGGGWVATEKNPSFNVNTWYMLTGTFDGKTLSYYVDGKLIKSVNTDVPNIDNCAGGEDFRIGRRHNYDKIQFRGYVDELGIWNRALSGDEIISLYNGCSGKISGVNKAYKNNTVNNGENKKSFECKQVTVGNQVWMAENLNVSKFRNGDPIPQAKSFEEWSKAASNGQPVWCYYEFNEANGVKYGKLYNWYAVNDSRGLAPNGWHVPSSKEFRTLFEFYGADPGYAPDLKVKLKSKMGWKQNGSNESGFTALPSGVLEFSSNRSYTSSGNFHGKGSSVYFWSTTCCLDYDSSASALQLDDYTCSLGSNNNKNHGYSVRCVKDN